VPEEVARRESDQWDAHELAPRDGASLMIAERSRPALLSPRTRSIALLQCHMIVLGCILLDAQ